MLEAHLLYWKGIKKYLSFFIMYNVKKDDILKIRLNIGGKKMKKIALSLLLIVICVGFVGCGNKNNTDEKNN